jgi:hypothetical protein
MFVVARRGSNPAKRPTLPIVRALFANPALCCSRWRMVSGWKSGCPSGAPSLREIKHQPPIKGDGRGVVDHVEDGGRRDHLADAAPIDLGIDRERLGAIGLTRGSGLAVLRSDQRSTLLIGIAYVLQPRLTVPPLHKPQSTSIPLGWPLACVGKPCRNPVREFPPKDSVKSATPSPRSGVGPRADTSGAPRLETVNGCGIAATDLGPRLMKLAVATGIHEVVQEFLRRRIRMRPHTCLG